MLCGPSNAAGSKQQLECVVCRFAESASATMTYAAAAVVAATIGGSGAALILEKHGVLEL